MSLVLTMTSMAVIAGLSLTNLSVNMIAEIVQGKKKVETEGYETIFNDSTLLYNTLINYDCHVDQISENEFHVETVHGKLHYFRENASQSFRLYFDHIENAEALMNSIYEFEHEYGRNVQDYTYHHIKENLADNMRIYDEQVIDDELVLTINVE